MTTAIPSTAKPWRLISYHPTWGEDWRHFATYIEAVEKRAELLAANSEVHYSIKQIAA